MDSTVRSRPNHYEVLGLTPAATGDEIAQAFAKELNPLRPRPFGSLAEVTIAYETLRDRTRREAYDIALGLKPKPTSPPPAPRSGRPTRCARRQGRRYDLPLIHRRARRRRRIPALVPNLNCRHSCSHRDPGRANRKRARPVRNQGRYRKSYAARKTGRSLRSIRSPAPAASTSLNRAASGLTVTRPSNGNYRPWRQAR